jgi:hypothetical protein
VSELLSRTLHPDRQNRTHDRILIFGERHPRSVLTRYGNPVNLIATSPLGGPEIAAVIPEDARDWPASHPLKFGR